VDALGGPQGPPGRLASLLIKGGDPPWRLPALHPLMGKKEKGRRRSVV
jgi:hypothetical protein